MLVLHPQIFLFSKMDGLKYFLKIPQSYHPILATDSNFTVSGCEAGLVLKEKSNEEAFTN